MMLEQAITHGHAAYILAVGYDAQRAHFLMAIQAHPHHEALARMVLFTDLQQFTDTWDTEGVVGSGDLDTLIGLDEYPEERGTRYCIRTSFREIRFSTQVKPIIVDENGNSSAAAPI